MWYLYTADFQLRFVIIEVNNTFGERRMYLFPAPKGTGNFSQTLPKDFHVSPFSSRNGSYVLATTDPAKSEEISVTVTLKSSKGHPKLVARLWSTAPAIDPTIDSVMSSLCLLVFWAWTTLVTCKRSVYV